ncbi:MAG TPA: polysaccharide biosynthesis/export family protein [Bryobacteraceae bacterium]|nr:polysaccharide biosynthesis/export family protein [Bryobacteraceae bacterium]
MRLLAVLSLFFALGVNAQVFPPSVPPGPISPDVNLPAQKVGPNDLLSISVADCPELTRNFRVAADGTLLLPLLANRIDVAGKYPPEIETLISQALINDQILVRPVVLVAVAEYRSVPVSVLGAVKHPMTFQAVGNVTLLDALAKAEGLTPDAGPEILVSKSEPGEHGKSSEVVQRIAIKKLIDDADPAVNIRLQGGEEIRVPIAGRVYVVGNVKKSGAFPIADGNDTSVLKIIALSEGLMPYSSKEAYIYRREGGKDGRNEIPIPLDRILQRKSPDVQLQANDILYIPDNKGRRLTAQTLERIAAFGTSTASGVLIWH